MQVRKCYLNVASLFLETQRKGPIGFVSVPHTNVNGVLAKRDREAMARQVLDANVNAES